MLVNVLKIFMTLMIARHETEAAKAASEILLMTALSVLDLILL